MGGRCRHVRDTPPALVAHLPVPRPAEESEEDESKKEDNEEGDDDVQKRRRIHWDMTTQNLAKQNVTLVHQLCHSNV